MLAFLVFWLIELLELIGFALLELVLIVVSFFWGDVLDARGED